MRTTFLAVALGVALSAAPGAPAQAQTAYVGQIGTFGFTYCPSGWLPTNGALLPISTYPTLFNVLGTTYGGDGTTTFAVPKTRPLPTAKRNAPLTQCIAYLGVYPSQN